MAGLRLMTVSLVLGVYADLKYKDYETRRETYKDT